MPVIYYVRHGETDYNAEARLQGRRDTLLNARGRQQVAEAAGILRDLFARDHRHAEDFGYVASPLKRARETMEIVRATLGLDPQVYATDPRLMEIAYGAWEGMTLEEIAVRMPEEIERRERDKWEFAPPGGGESYRHLAKRIGDWYRSLTRDTVVAAHGGGVRALMAIFKVMSEDDATHAPIAQGVVYVFANGTMTRYA
jgi:broad specificity phosphatase PhoE